MKLKSLSLLVLMIVSLTSCAQKQYTKQNAAFIVFKTPAFKYADLGFIYENDDEIKVEIYSSGQALISLEISEESVCMSLLACMSKNEFNQEVLSGSYPGQLLTHVFQGRPIFNALGLKKRRNGFTQKIINMGKYDIEYSVLNKQIIFRDTINKILIKVKKQ